MTNKQPVTARLLEKASQALRRSDLAAFSGAMLEVFVANEVSEPARLVVNALLFSAQNAIEDPAIGLLEAIQEGHSALCRNLTPDFEEAIDIIEGVESAGCNVAPRGLAEAIEALQEAMS